MVPSKRRRGACPSFRQKLSEPLHRASIWQRENESGRSSEVGRSREGSCDGWGYDMRGHYMGGAMRGEELGSGRGHDLSALYGGSLGNGMTLK